MKHCIYLSCCIVIMLLCSCKSNSFLVQRYTTYGHERHHATIDKNATTQAHKHMRAHHAETPVRDTVSADISLSADAATPGAVGLNARSRTIFPAKAITSLVMNQKATYTKLQAELVTSGQQNIETKQSMKEKAHRTAGLFNTLFKIVLWCIILAVLVAIILIILLA